MNMKTRPVCLFIMDGYGINEDKNGNAIYISGSPNIKYYTENYDTYNCKGLPAGPICNPGLDAINAVLNPEETEYYYFCNNLDTGKAYFAKTLEEHEKNLVKAGLVEAE